jgi:hypothetical protein
MEKHTFSYFSGNIKDSITVGTTSLGRVIRDIARPDERTIDLIYKIRSTNDESEKARLKWKLKSYTPCIKVTKYRRYDNIEYFSGLLALDFDKLPSNEYAIEFKNYLFNEYPFIYATWLSSSGKGVRGFVHIQRPESVDHFKSIFNAIEQDLGIYDGFDPAPKNAVLPLFQSYDPNMLWRKEADKYTRTYIKPEPPRPEPMPVQVDDKTHQRIIEILKSAINKIDSNGHPQLRGASYALGGYVGAGYISHYDAISLIDNLIESNKYLSIKPAVYKQTARTMINKGQSQPLYL